MKDEFPETYEYYENKAKGANDAECDVADKATVGEQAADAPDVGEEAPQPEDESKESEKAESGENDA